MKATDEISLVNAWTVPRLALPDPNTCIPTRSSRVATNVTKLCCITRQTSFIFPARFDVREV
jgi:hypothetical protein